MGLKIFTDETGSRVELPYQLKLKDIPEDTHSTGTIWLTSNGYTFIRPQEEATGQDVVWRKDGKWFGLLRSDLIRCQITGYSSIERAGGVPVTLVDVTT
jgi:hypothetical protein